MPSEGCICVAAAASAKNALRRPKTGRECPSWAAAMQEQAAAIPTCLDALRVWHGLRVGGVGQQLCACPCLQHIAHQSWAGRCCMSYTAVRNDKCCCQLERFVHELSTRQLLMHGFARHWQRWAGSELTCAATCSAL